MIDVNGKEIVYKKGMTVADALKEIGVYNDFMSLVMIEGKVIAFDQYNNVQIVDGTSIKLLTIISGG